MPYTSPSSFGVCNYSHGVNTLKNSDWEGSLFNSGAKAFGRQKKKKAYLL